MNIKVISLLTEAITELAKENMTICRDATHMSTPHMHVPMTTILGESVGAYFDKTLSPASG